MPWRSISSGSHAAAKRLARLAAGRRQRERGGGHCVVGGATLVEELLGQPSRCGPPTTVVAARAALPPSLRDRLDTLAAGSGPGGEFYDATGDAAAVLKRVSALSSAGEGTATVVAEFALPQNVHYLGGPGNAAAATDGDDDSGHIDRAARSAQLLRCLSGGIDGEGQRRPHCGDPRGSRVVVLDGVADPGNLGAVLRSGLALGFDAAVLLRGCCDPFNPKAIRAARAAQWGMRGVLVNATWADVGHVVDALGARLVAADSSSSAPAASSPPPSSSVPAQQRPVVLAVGNESRGLSLSDAALLRRCERVHIPMCNGVESLNVAVATALLMQRFA